jgi:hypothetical protein
VTWRKGQSGNPKGRPPGVGEVARLRAAISQHLPEVLDRLVQQARDGDTQAARLLLERVLPPVKAVALPEPLPVPAVGSLAERAEAVLAAMAKGEASADAAEAALAGLGAVARLRLIDDLERRIAALEERSKPDGRKLEAADRGA